MPLSQQNNLCFFKYIIMETFMSQCHSRSKTNYDRSYWSCAGGSCLNATLAATLHMKQWEQWEQWYSNFSMPLSQQHYLYRGSLEDLLPKASQRHSRSNTTCVKTPSPLKKTIMSQCHSRSNISSDCQ